MHQAGHTRHFVAVILVVTLVAACAPDRKSLPEGWREFTAEDPYNQLEWREEDPDRYLRVVADFDGNGEVDEARLLVSNDGHQMALFVFLARDRGHRSILLDKGPVANLGIARVEPGEYVTAAGKGYWEPKPGEPETVSLVNPAINYFKHESANSFFYWDESKDAFSRVWISD